MSVVMSINNLKEKGSIVLLSKKIIKKTKVLDLQNKITSESNITVLAVSFKADCLRVRSCCYGQTTDNKEQESELINGYKSVVVVVVCCCCLC